jgi:hypothetical protein
MPLTQLQFDLGISAETERWMRRLLSFLRDHRDSAYNQQELFDAVADARAHHEYSLCRALEELTYLGGADQRTVRGETYYAFLDPVPELELQSGDNELQVRDP